MLTGRGHSITIMNPIGENDIWTAPRLATRLAALHGVAPAPSCYVIHRTTIPRHGAPSSGYELAGEAVRRDEASFEQWLMERHLAGVERLSVSVLTIREHLDPAGLVTEGVLERRRGGFDGPLYGKIARVVFTGPATAVSCYQALPDGRLVELPPEPDSLPAEPPDVTASESFAGEDAAIHAFLGPDAVILDRRIPNRREDLLGLTGIIHARRRNGEEIACGVGWHGGTAFVLAADFPRLGPTLVAPPALAAAVAELARTEDLIPYETRQDEAGFCVMARRRGRRTLVAIRWDGQAAHVEPYLPGRVTAGTDDQRRWMIYAETYEARNILDTWRNGERDELILLTADPDGDAWCHTVNADGIEIGRRPGNDTAAAVLFKERLNDPTDNPETQDLPGPSAASPEQPAPANSLLTKVRAYLRVTALLREATEACGTGTNNDAPVPQAALDRLHDLVRPLSMLNAAFSAGSVLRLIRQADSGGMTVRSFAAALEDMVTRLRDELALTRIVLLPSPLRQPEDEPPFGNLVEGRFPLAAYDIEEAVHCLALRRTTAAVLHAMKVMRHGLTGLESLLGIPPLANLSWARITTVVREAAGDRRELLTALRRVRRVWRGPGLMPADKYTEEEAEAVLDAVATFMRVLAASFEGSGEPAGD